MKAAVEGQLDDRADAGRHQGDFRKIVEGVNEMLDAILLPIGEGNRILAQISNGKIDELIAQTYRGDHEKMKQAVNNVAIGAARLQKELARLTEASREGQLSERGKPEQFQGAYAGIVKGVNEMLDAILLPIGEGNRILGLIRGGNLREKVEIACKGDHEKMKQAVNGVHDWLTDLIAYVTKIANGDMTASMAKASDQDQIHEWLVLLKNNINALVADTSMLAQAAADGRVGTRADASKHQGDYRKIVEGFNQTLDAIVEPLKVTAQNADDAGLFLRRTDGGQPADGGQRGGDRDAGQRGLGGQRASFEECRLGRFGLRADASLHPRDRQERQRVGAGGQERRQRGAFHQRDREEAGRIQPGNRQCDQGDYLDRAADQPAGAERHHRSGARRRSGQGLRGGGQRGEGTRQADRQGHRRDRPEDRGHPGRHQGRGQGDRGDRHHHQPDQRYLQQHRLGGGRADGDHQRDRPQRDRSAKGVGDIAKNIGGVALAAKNTTQGANDTQKASQELSQMAARLQRSLSKFTF